MPRMNIEELERFVEQEFPNGRRPWTIAHLDEGELEVRLPFHDDFLRPGNTISGPVMMGLVDTTAYMLILSMIGPVGLAVTTSLNINFMRRPSPEELSARARMLKLGKQLAVVEVLLYLSASDTLVAQSTVTYSIPPNAGS